METRLIGVEALKRDVKRIFKDEADAFIRIIDAQDTVVVPISNTSDGNIYYKTKCYSDGRLVRQICTGERCGSHPYD